MKGNKGMSQGVQGWRKWTNEWKDEWVGMKVMNERVKERMKGKGWMIERME